MIKWPEVWLIIMKYLSIYTWIKFSLHYIIVFNSVKKIIIIRKVISGLMSVTLLGLGIFHLK